MVSDASSITSNFVANQHMTNFSQNDSTKNCKNKFVCPKFCINPALTTLKVQQSTDKTNLVGPLDAK